MGTSRTGLAFRVGAFPPLGFGGDQERRLRSLSLGCRQRRGKPGRQLGAGTHPGESIIKSTSYGGDGRIRTETFKL